MNAGYHDIFVGVEVLNFDSVSSNMCLTYDHYSIFTLDLSGAYYPYAHSEKGENHD